MLYLATNNGLLAANRDGDWVIVERGLIGINVTSVMAREGVILAGTTDGIYHSADQGRTWEETNAGLSQRHIRWLAFHPDVSDCEFAGTEPASIFISTDGASSWREAGEVAALRDRYHWFLPYSPEAGCVRGFAFHGSRGYAAVEVGGVLRSDDSGSSWQLAEGSDGKPVFGHPPDGFVHPDVHSIYVHPSSPDLVFAATGGGFYRSVDGGKRWSHLYDCYCRAAWIDPANPAHIILGPADNVDSNGRIEESNDGGETWRPASGGLEVPWARHMVERFTRVGDELIGVLSNGRLISSRLAVLSWGAILPDAKDVNAAAGE